MRSSKANMDVPYLSERTIGLRAKSFLDAYAEKKGWKPEPPVPVESILENFLKLAFSVMDLEEALGIKNVEGALWMEAGEVGVDHRLDPEVHPHREGRYNFTLAHEIGHWHLHRRYVPKRPDATVPFGWEGEWRGATYVCRSDARDRVKIQANLFASALLMPKSLVLEAWQRLYGEGPMHPRDLPKYGHAALGNGPLMHRGRFPRNEDAYFGALLEAVIRPLTRAFRVSLQAMRIRLEGLQLLPSPPERWID